MVHWGVSRRTPVAENHRKEYETVEEPVTDDADEDLDERKIV
jgi:hypothetical protein